MAVAATPADLFDVTTSFALQEKKKLRKHFARFDILFYVAGASTRRELVKVPIEAEMGVEPLPPA